MRLPASAWRFALVGVMSTAVHVLVAGLLIGQADWHPGAANAVAFAIANLASYGANSLWSFRAPLDTRRFGRFALVSGLAFGLTVAIASAVDAGGGHPALGIALVVVLVPGLSYAAHRWYTFTGDVPASPPP
jgi:putative flippase GtrA